MNFYTETSTTTDVLSGRLRSRWDTITHASRNSLMLFSGVDSGTEKNILGLLGDQKIYTYGIHNNPSTIATYGSTQSIASGEYNPTVVAANGWAPTILISICAQWLRVGNVVTVSGELDVTPSGTGGVGDVDIQLPVATDATGCSVSGVCAAYDRTLGTTGSSGIIDGPGSNNARLRLSFATTNAHTVKYHYTYVVVDL